MIIENKTKRLLREGKLALGLALRHSRTVEIAQIAAVCGFDWLFIDCEHSAMTVDTAAQLSSASLGFGVTPIVRAPGIEHHHSTRALDNSAQGVVIPHVEARPRRRPSPASHAFRHWATARWAARWPRPTTPTSRWPIPCAWSTRRRWSSQ